ncbi:unnamed protein product, partial [Sphacelaria rigidula]
ARILGGPYACLCIALPEYYIEGQHVCCPEDLKITDDAFARQLLASHNVVSDQSPQSSKRLDRVSKFDFGPVSSFKLNSHVGTVYFMPLRSLGWCRRRTPPTPGNFR